MNSLERYQVITHRGLEPGREDFFSESSLEAFKEHLRRGFGIEFDVNFTKDWEIVIAHDKGLERITKGRDKRFFREVNSDEVRGIGLENGRIPFFGELMELIQRSGSRINVLHLKGGFQKEEYFKILLEHLKRYEDLLSRILIFDVKPETAQYLKENNTRLILAPSVAHSYDIKRYNEAVLGTLISLEEAVRYKELFDWVWFDEWDRTDGEGREKKFYTGENFEKLRRVGYKIALVTPELHGSSPGLLGGEAHQDAKDKETLFVRIKEIIELKPDVLCTDYPEEVLNL